MCESRRALGDTNPGGMVLLRRHPVSEVCMLARGCAVVPAGSGDYPPLYRCYAILGLAASACGARRG